MTIDPAAARGRTARGEDRRRQLLEAGIACLVEGGWAALTHRRVASTADSTLGLVRYHFGDLVGLRREVARAVSGGLVAPLREVLAGAADRRDWIDRVVALTTSSRAAPREVSLLLQVLVGSLTYPEVSEVVVDDVRGMREALCDSLLDLPNPPTPDRAAELSAFVLSAADGLLLGEAIARAPVGSGARLLREVLTGLLSD